MCSRVTSRGRRGCATCRPTAQAMGEVVMRRNNVMMGHFTTRGRDRARPRWRLVPQRRSRRDARRRLYQLEAPQQGNPACYSGRREHSTIEVEQSILPSCTAAVLDVPRWRAPRALGRRRPGVRHAPNQAAPDRRHHRVLPRARSRASKSAQATSSSRSDQTSTGKIQKFVLREREWQGSTSASSDGRSFKPGERFAAWPIRALRCLQRATCSRAAQRILSQAARHVGRVLTP